MSTYRNRSEGWRHAKVSGHENEEDVEQFFQHDDFRRHIEERLGVPRIVQATVGGICEKNVSSILGDLTKSKTDLRLVLEDGKNINISIKKSSGGQVYLIGVDRFIAGFELHFKKIIPKDVKEALYLFFFGHTQTDKILEDPTITGDLSTHALRYVKKRHRLTETLLRRYNSNMADALISWFNENKGLIADFCFSKGLAANKGDWADYVWYINLLGEDSFDTIYPINDIVYAVDLSSDKVFYGNRQGGTTIQLPFGFVQWHQEQIQFHHNLDKIVEILPNGI
ncbi:MAG: hypothetical protein J6X91_02205 [Bacteroidales bacterium]|nr:hypothetical protein [Bacteroidales bacterium]